MDDNVRPQRTLAVEELLESEDITRMDWPAYSPDLNPIELVWDALGRRIEARLHHPESTQQLKQMLIEEWVLLPQEMLHQLVLSMRRRLEEAKFARSILCQYDLAWFHPSFKGEHLEEWSEGHPPTFSFHQPHRRICGSTAILNAPMPSPGFELKPYGIAVNVINHYTGWVATTELAYFSPSTRLVWVLSSTFYKNITPPLKENLCTSLPEGSNSSRVTYTPELRGWGAAL
ncbi:transposable element Tcb2 transposase [Trichonephila clavipes]|nr:transposable element Tcb2 transposase [Trichonephila clavipes]